MIPNTMKAWVLNSPGVLRLKEVEVPKIREDQVLIEIDRACICNGSDPGIFHGHEAYQTPLIFGHEASGRIVKKGNQVERFAVGQRVCWWFEAGAFAQYQAVTPGNVAMFQVPANLTLDEAPVMELVLAACRALMEVRAGKGRRTISICGLGPSGLEERVAVVDELMKDGKITFLQDYTTRKKKEVAQHGKEPENA